MSKFTFSYFGKPFVVEGPANATVAQAQAIFDQQVAAGALIGLRTGDKRTSVGETFVTFSQSRLDPGTAGIGDFPILAINNGQVISALPTLNIAPVTAQSDGTTSGTGANNTGIDTADYTQQAKVTQPIGPLSPTQVQAMLAAAATVANQPSDVLSADGVGKYKLTGPQLEQMGYLKPGTCCRYLDLCNDPLYQPLTSGTQ